VKDITASFLAFREGGKGTKGVNGEGADSSRLRLLRDYYRQRCMQERPQGEDFWKNGGGGERPECQRTPTDLSSKEAKFTLRGGEGGKKKDLGVPKETFWRRIEVNRTEASLLKGRLPRWRGGPVPYVNEEGKSTDLRKINFRVKEKKGERGRKTVGGDAFLHRRLGAWKNGERCFSSPGLTGGMRKLGLQAGLETQKKKNDCKGGRVFFGLCRGRKGN